MKQLVLFVFIAFVGQASAQSRTFINKAKEQLQATDQTFEIEEVTPEIVEYDFLSDGAEGLEQLFLAKLKSISRNKPDTLSRSHTLSNLAKIATEAWRGSQYSDNKKWKKLAKYFRRASNQCTSKFNIMKQVSFRIPLVDNDGKKFYYDRYGDSEDLNLYFGRKPKSKEEREEAVQIPLKYFTEDVLIEKFLRLVRRKRLYGDLKRGYFNCVGISVEIDENTLHKNKIPTARVVVIMGARRLRNVKVRYEPKK